MGALMLRMRGREAVAQPVHRPGQIEYAQKNQHERDGEFERESQPRWNHNSKENDRSADDQNGERMADSPQDSDPTSAENRALAAHDGGDGNDMVGIGSVAHAKEEADADDEQDARHKAVQS